MLGFVDVEKRVTERIDRLEGRMEKGFESLAAAISKLTNTVEEGFRHMNVRFDVIEHDISDLPAIREELEDLRERVGVLEKKVGAHK